MSTQALYEIESFDKEMKRKHEANSGKTKKSNAK